MFDEKQKFLGQVIDVKLSGKYENSGYSALCFYKYIMSKGKYELSMWLRRNDIDDLFSIGAQKIDKQMISGTKETIRDNIGRVVDYMCNSEYFDYFIERFDYTYKCCDIGGNVMEGVLKVAEN